MSKTQPARGMRDFLPADIRKREFVIGIIKEVYESYGFEPLETPAVENLETLTGKYGEEGNQLMFKILKRGEKLDVSQGEKGLSDLALRYDLTVPLARVVANYRERLPRFFKRYQIQPVWRADRPARGRFREFYQCDVDAIGSSSMIVEAELISAVSEILTRLGFEDFTIRVNHRKVLTGILETCGVPIEKHTDALIALDKIDKIGREGVEREFKERGISDEAGMKLLTSFEYFIKEKSGEIFDEKQKLKLVNLLRKQKVSSDELNQMIAEAKLSEAKEGIQPGLSESLKESKNASESYSTLRNLKEFVSKNETGISGFEELKEIWLLANTILGLIFRIKIDPTLARGLSYYTGAIFEVNVPDFAGSLAGGGRYDGLIGMFGKEAIPACGLSIGLERILVVMEERGMFDKLIAEGKLKADSADVLITIWNEESVGESLKLAGELRQTSLRVLVYPEADKLGKQFKYAAQINIPFVCVLGETELAENKVTLKNMTTGAQETVSREEIASKIAKHD